MGKGCLTDKTNMYRISNGKKKHTLNAHRTHKNSQVRDSIILSQNLVHNFIVPPKKSQHKRCKGEGVAEGTLIPPYIRRLGPLLEVQIKL